jgi:hypothetical protein
MKIEKLGLTCGAVLAIGVMGANAEPASDVFETVTYTDWVCRAVPPSPPPPPPPPPPTPCDNLGGGLNSFSLDSNGNLSFTSIGFGGFGCDSGLGGLGGFGGFQLQDNGGSRVIDECREGFQREPFETTETTRTCTNSFTTEGSFPFPTTNNGNVCVN